MKEMNVVGTMQLLAACQESPTVTRRVVKSTGAVYGASPRIKLYLQNVNEPNGIPALGYPENAAEVEGYIVVSFGAARMLPSQAAPTGAAPTGWKALATPLAAPQAVESAELAVHELRRYRDLADLRHF
jgi:hypothetical protein